MNFSQASRLCLLNTLASKLEAQVHYCSRLNLIAAWLGVTLGTCRTAIVVFQLSETLLAELPLAVVSESINARYSINLGMRNEAARSHPAETVVNFPVR